MTNIREALSAPVQKKVKCQFCDWLLSLDGDDRAAIVEFYKSDLTTTDLVKRLKPYGLPTGHHSMAEHRDGKHSEVL